MNFQKNSGGTVLSMANLLGVTVLLAMWFQAAAVAAPSEMTNQQLNPYAEADGQPVQTEKVWSFRDLE
jgi:hypothetical protein